MLSCYRSPIIFQGSCKVNLASFQGSKICFAYFSFLVFPWKYESMELTIFPSSRHHSRKSRNILWSSPNLYFFYLRLQCPSPKSYKALVTVSFGRQAFVKVNVMSIFQNDKISPEDMSKCLPAFPTA